MKDLDFENNNIVQNNNMFVYNRGSIITAHIADLHFGAMDPSKQFSILEDQFLSKLIAMPKLDLVCINGDTFNSKVTTSSDTTLYASMFVSRLVDIVKQKNATLIILQGTSSHDANQLRIYYHYMNRQDIDVRIVTNLRFEIVKNARILCIPELYGMDESIYQQYLTYSGFYDFAIMHGTIEGSVYGNNVGNGRLFTFNDFMNCRGPVLAGHVHKAQTLQNHIYYCGSPYRWRFDDDCFKGFIFMGMDLDNRLYYLDYNEIFSDTYKTISLDELIHNNPLDTIQYIRDLKTKQNINYIKVRFTTDVPSTSKMTIMNQFRGDNSVSLEFYSQVREFQKQAEERVKEDNEKYGFLLDPRLNEYQKFVLWVNHLKNDETYLTVEELERILKEE